MKEKLYALLFFIVAGAIGYYMYTNVAVKRHVTIVVLGDSLSSGYNIPAEKSFPAQLEALLKENRANATVLSESVPGSTTEDGLARLDKAIAMKPDIVLVALGGNDMLRGISPKVTQNNLEAIVQKLQAQKIGVLVAGMKAPINAGLQYSVAFNIIYLALAEKYDITLMPYLLKDVARAPTLNLPDGIHPNEKGVAVMAQNMVPYARRAIEKLPRKKD